jgi:hypothetical protein
MQLCLQRDECLRCGLTLTRLDPPVASPLIICVILPLRPENVTFGPPLWVRPSVTEVTFVSMISEVQFVADAPNGGETFPA